MATQFDFLSQAKPASLYKLLEKLSTGDAAIVLTGLPHNLAIQTLAFFPDAMQAPMLSAMRDARGVSQDLRQTTAKKIRSMLDAAKSAREGKTAVAPRPEQAAPAPAPAPAPQAGARTPPAPAAKPFGMDPGASILSGDNSPAEAEDIPEAQMPRPGVIPLTPKFSPPRQMARKPAQTPTPQAPTAHPGAAAYQQGPTPQKPAQTQKTQQTPPPARPPAAKAGAQNFAPGANPYESAPPAQTPPPREAVETGDRTPNSGELIGQALSDLGEKIKKAFTPASERDKAKTANDGFRTKAPAESRSVAPGARKRPDPSPTDGKPVPWVPRAATSSPINGPALPGKPPPVTGDPFKSPLAKAGLLDLIGRAQEKFLPKGTVERAAPQPPKPRVPPRVPPKKGKNGKPEPVEGVVRSGGIRVDSTPRVIGPRPRGEELLGEDRVTAGEGARRMDGKAILAAILRNSTPEVRGKVAAEDPNLFRELRGRMFYFDDLIYTDEGALARVFTAAPADVAALALRFAAPKLRDRVLGAVSPGRARALRDCPGRAGVDDIEAAQKQVLGVALQLQAAGRILIDPRDPDLAGG